jgi:hypothetical protein
MKPFLTPKSLVHTNEEVDEGCFTPTIIYLIYIRNWSIYVVCKIN